MKSRCFKRFCAYSISLKSSNVGTFFLELNSKRLYRSSGKDKESRCLEFTFSTKTYNYAFSRRSRAVTAKKCTKKCGARTYLLFCQSKPISFLPFSLTSPSSLLTLGTDVSITYAEVIIDMDWTLLSTIRLRQESSEPKPRLAWQTT